MGSRTKNAAVWWIANADIAIVSVILIFSLLRADAERLEELGLRALIPVLALAFSVIAMIVKGIRLLRDRRTQSTEENHDGT